MRTSSVPSVLVMAKAPRPGTVKTRLHPLLGPDGCAALQAELIRHTFALITGHGLRCHVAHAPAEARGALATLVPADVGLLPQRGPGLGRRLAAAVEDVFGAGFGPLFALDPDLWGGDRVFDATRALAEEEGRLTVAALPELRDLDTPEDAAAHLDAFSAGDDGELPARVAALLRPPERA